MTDILGEIGSPVPVPSDNGDVPPVTGNVIDPPTSSDPTCIVCGAPLSYSGRGRKPRYCSEHKRQTTSNGPRATRGGGDVDKAMAVLESFYDATSLGLMLVSPAYALPSWQQSLPQLRNTDVLALQSDPELCRAICRMGETSGKAMFVTAHVMAVIPVALALRKDFAERKFEKQRQEADLPNDVSGLGNSNGRSYGNSELF